ncbi:AAA family ATPase [Roseibium aggregatum]|uniref:AAA family ATPase n=1 Tax=Roseibium aggregatum TaxID=187304 RepID=UPI001E5F478C|nr:AAA family ATPase [Roseibium aggregatum]
MLTPEQWQAEVADNYTAKALAIRDAGGTRTKRYFETVDTSTLLATEYPEIRWIVPGYLPEGFAVLAGRQKLGKTWLAIDLSVAVALGGYAMGSIACYQGDVLYIDMENGNRRIKKRIETLFPDNQPDLSRLRWAKETILLNAGFMDAIEEWRVNAPHPRLIVIDVLTRIKPAGSRSRNAYENDYAAFAGLQNWAIENGVAVLALHHTRKGGAEDPLEALSGSNGLSAVADTTLVLDRNSNGFTLYGRGRDVPEKETALTFDGGRWTIQGEASDVHRSEQRSKIMSVLRDATEPMVPATIAKVTSMKPGNVRRLLSKMVADGEVHKTGRGQYVHPENKHFVTDSPDAITAGNIGNSGNNSSNIVSS